ncbi:DcuS/MalK family sensor histidine kinase [Metabacillus arenae]|uniref:histidine kinase n=1 Tax=Metabacillus arenae TaxID=2771434 RepID=A0A926NLH5_9BACI|nr:DcuS/MalK family sensor histidine kinase [Metabacillus arenae]MBD1382798.1 two-component system sensor histidine kinase DcuS [Metabacillus arenae]
MSKQKFKLSTIIIFFVCLVVLLSLLFTDLLISHTVSNSIRVNLEEKAKIVSRTVAKSVIVKNGLENEEQDEGAIQQYTSEIQQATNVLFVVVMDMNGIRKSHPNPAMIGKSFVGGDEKAVLNGKEHISLSTGTLGQSLRAFTPIYGPDNEQIGAVAVGISLNIVEQALEKGHQNIIIGSIIGILVGVLGAVILARYIKKILFGLEPLTIAKIHEERNTMLQSVHEGIIAVDKDSTITLVNKSALRIFMNTGLPDNPVGMKLTEYMPSSKLDRVLKTGKPEQDVELTVNGVSILVNRVPLIVNKEIVGALSTFRDKTEVHQLAEQLTGVRMYAEALRAQSHEFMNRLHVILGLVKMGCFDELKKFINQIVDHRVHEIDHVTKNIKDPALAGFIMGKLSYARENLVEMRIENETVIPEPREAYVTHELITILGNVIDNAIEALNNMKEKKVQVKLNYSKHQLQIKIRDSGPGLKKDQFTQIFEKGYSTKGSNRGYGLYLVNKSIESLGGSIQLNLSNENGTEFIIQIPYEVKEGDE